MDNNAVDIRNVWKHNLEEEFSLIKSIVKNHPYIGLDSEYAGAPTDPRITSYFDSMVKNVNEMKVIQIGLTFMSKDGSLPSFNGKKCVWQFNFSEFNEESDIYVPTSLEFVRSHGIDLQKFREDGVSVTEFGQLMLASGAVLDGTIKWISFQGAYDFGYLLKALTGQNIPTEIGSFFRLMKTYFPVFYDVRYLARKVEGIQGGLEKVAEKLEIKRIGEAHQAGSDSLLTCSIYLKLRKESLCGSSPEREDCALYDL